MPASVRPKCSKRIWHSFKKGSGVCKRMVKGVLLCPRFDWYWTELLAIFVSRDSR